MERFQRSFRPGEAESVRVALDPCQNAMQLVESRVRLCREWVPVGSVRWLWQCAKMGVTKACGPSVFPCASQRFTFGGSSLEYRELSAGLECGTLLIRLVASYSGRVP